MASRNNKNIIDKKDNHYINTPALTLIYNLKEYFTVNKYFSLKSLAKFPKCFIKPVIT